MKKLIYILMFAIATALTVTSCTEEQIEPSTSLNGGGAGSERSNP